MRSYTNLNEELDQVLTSLEKIDNELENILFPIKKIIKDNYSVLCERFPVNIKDLPIIRIIEKTIILKSDLILFAKISNEEKNQISKIILKTINELKLIMPEQEDASNRKKELYSLINERKKYLQVKYEKLKNIDFRISNSSVAEDKQEYKKLLKYKEDIISDKELCEDLMILFDYDNFDIINNSKTTKEKHNSIDINNIKTIEDLYKLVDLTIEDKINEYMEYRYLTKTRINELSTKLRNSVSGYVEGYIIMNSNLSNNIEDFYNIIKIRLSGELEEYFEIKNKLGVEYVTSKDNNNSKIITIKDVVEGNYNGTEYNIINKYATLLELSEVDEENLDVVRRFVINMGPEFVPIFDNLWIQPDAKRRTKILEQKKLNKKKENID